MRKEGAVNPFLLAKSILARGGQMISPSLVHHSEHSDTAPPNDGRRHCSPLSL